MLKSMLSWLIKTLNRSLPFSGEKTNKTQRKNHQVIFYIKLETSEETGLQLAHMHSIV